MKIKISSLLPDRWNQNADIRAFVLTLIVLGGILILDSAYRITAPRAFLLSGLFAILVVYWIPPRPKVTYVEWILSNSLLWCGLFLFLFKIPYLFLSFLSYPSAQILCTLVYGISCWLFLKRMSEAQHSD
jgi:hypothetical protein